MGTRRTGRLLAMQTLYQLDFGQTDIAFALANALAGKTSTLEAKAFAERLVYVAHQNRDPIDALIQMHSQGYTLSRLGGVVRNILRLAIAELVYVQEVDPAVIIDEALSLCREYASEEAVPFINGVLGGVLTEQVACSPV